MRSKRRRLKFTFLTCKNAISLKLIHFIRTTDGVNVSRELKEWRHNHKENLEQFKWI